MTAQVLFLHPSPSGRKSGFQDVGELLAFDFPDPIWVSDDLAHARFDAKAQALLREFFDWFGVEVDVDGCAESLAAGWEFLGAEVGTALVYRDEYPKTFSSLYANWSDTQRAYLEAVKQGNRTAAQHLVHQSGFLGQLREKMRTPVGCALK